jgi:hypothetical protein
MKKILSLLLLSSSIFSMQLQVVRPSKTQYKSSDISKAAFARATTTPTSFTMPHISHEVDVKKVHVPHQLDGVKLYHSEKGFVVLHDNKQRVINKCLVDKIARDMTPDQLKSFLKLGYLAINQSNDGSFMLKANQRLAGGGPIFGAFMYWATKSLCYGTAVAAVGTVAVGTGGVVVLAASSTLAAAGGATIVGVAGATTIATVTGAAATTTVAAGTITAIAGLSAGAVSGGATVLATAIGASSAAGVTIAGMSVATAATTATVGVVSSAGGIAATIAGVEAVSLAIGTFFGMLPTP